MKKIYQLIAILFFCLNISANPIPNPTVGFSELYFDDSAKWMLELQYSISHMPEGFTFDSVFIFSISDTVELPDYEFEGEYGVFVLTQDSLDAIFHINPEGDTLRIISYFHGIGSENSLIFGSSAISHVACPQNGQSVSRYKNDWYRDNAPNIGEINDPEGICGTLSGIVFDMELNPVAQRKFSIDFPFETDEDGHFEARVLAKSTKFGRMDYYTVPDAIRSIIVEVVSYTLEPDSVIEQNIFLKEEMISSVQSSGLVNQLVRIYPNPVQSTNKLILEVDFPVKSADVIMEIYGLDGKLIKKTRIEEKKTYLDPPLESGFYIVNVSLNKKLVSSNKIMVNNE